MATAVTVRLGKEPLDASPAIRNLISDFYFPQQLINQILINNVLVDKYRINHV